MAANPPTQNTISHMYGMLSTTESTRRYMCTAASYITHDYFLRLCRIKQDAEIELILICIVICTESCGRKQTI